MLNQKKEEFLVKEAILNAITILDADLKSNNIELNINYETYEEIKYLVLK